MNATLTTEEKLRALPKAPSADPVNEVLQLLEKFVQDLNHRVKGTPDKDGLLQSIRPCQEIFKVAIRSTRPNFVPWKKTADKELPEPKFLEDEDGDSTMPGEHDHCTSQKIYVEEVLTRAEEYAFLLRRLMPQLDGNPQQRSNTRASGQLSFRDPMRLHQGVHGKMECASDGSLRQGLCDSEG